MCLFVKMQGYSVGKINAKQKHLVCKKWATLSEKTFNSLNDIQ